MDLIRLGRAERPEPTPRISIFKAWQTWVLLPATAVATAAVMLVVTPRLGEKESGDFQSRGAGTRELDQWVSIQAFRGTADGYEEVRDRIAPDDALAFTYRNRPDSRFRFLMVFGVDEVGRVYWYYPQHNDPAANPGSISIDAVPGVVELPEQVAHDLGTGSFRLFGLFSPEPLAVDEVERVAGNALAAAGGIEQLRRLEIEGIGQHSLLLRVEKMRPGDRH
jgi:hypothetical protein